MIFTLWYHPSHFGLHVDDLCTELARLGYAIQVVAPEVTVYADRFFNAFRESFVGQAPEHPVIRLPLLEFTVRDPFPPIVRPDPRSAPAARVRRLMGGDDLLVFHFFEHFLPFAGAIARDRRQTFVYYPGNFIRRIAGHYGLDLTPAVARAVLDASLADMYDPCVRRISGVDAVLSETRSLAADLALSGLRGRLVYLGRPVRGDRVVAAAPVRLKSTLGIAPDAALLLYAGRLSKNSAVLPEILRRVRGQLGADVEVHLLIVSSPTADPTVLPGYREQSRFIHAMPFAERDALYSYLAEADVLLHTGLVDGHPKVISESHVAGLPVVAFDAPASAVSEIIEDQVTGLLVAPGDLEGYARAVVRLLRSTDLRRRLASNGKALHDPRSVPDFTARLASLLPDGTGRPPSGGPPA
jgi:glycosyltransferase involved in cell wall biosynthesis